MKGYLRGPNAQTQTIQYSSVYLCQYTAIQEHGLILNEK